MIRAEITARSRSGGPVPGSPDHLFADEGACLHYSYTTFEEAEAVLTAQWLGSGDIQVCVRLIELGRPRGRSRAVTLTGARDETVRMLAAIGIRCGTTGESDDRDDVGSTHTER